jgi:hypothetical protein
MMILLVESVGSKPEKGSDEAGFGGVGDVRGRAGQRPALGRWRYDRDDPHGRAEIDRLRAEHRSPEAETSVPGRVMGMDVADLPAVRGAVDGAVVLGVIEVEHAEGEDDGERQDRGLSHIGEIIPRMPGTVNKKGAARRPPPSDRGVF